jgi:hypothetical protein
MFALYSYACQVISESRSIVPLVVAPSEMLLSAACSLIVVCLSSLKPAAAMRLVTMGYGASLNSF